MPYRRVVESVGNTGAWALFLVPRINSALELNSDAHAIALQARFEERRLIRNRNPTLRTADLTGLRHEDGGTK